MPFLVARDSFCVRAGRSREGGEGGVRSSRPAKPPAFTCISCFHSLGRLKILLSPSTTVKSFHVREHALRLVKESRATTTDPATFGSPGGGPGEGRSGGTFGRRGPA
jgi:hypothetical protein